MARKMLDISLGISILLTTLSVNAEGGSQSQADEYSRASRAIAEIYYNQSGVKETIKSYEKKFVPKDIRVIGGNLAVLTKMAIEQKIIFKWDF